MSVTPTDALRADLLARREALLRSLAELDAPPVDGHGDLADLTDAMERRAYVTARHAQVAASLRAIDVALARLAAGTYGRCAACGGAISAIRLYVMPAADHCLDCQAERERAAARETARTGEEPPAC